MTNILKAKDIYFSYKKGDIINGASFEITSGINLLLGENGSGKSTLMKILGGIYKASSGEIYLNDISYKDELEIKKNIGYVPQKFNSFQNIKVEEYLSFISSFNDHGNIDLSLLEIDNFKDKYMRELSEGMQKRVLVAAALSLNPKVILADEPTSGLDKNGRIKLRKLFSIINEKFPEKIIIFSSHLDEDIYDDVNFIYEVKNGKVIKYD